MPGPVSDSYDPEFGTGENAHAVRQGMEGVITQVAARLGPELCNIVDVANGQHGDYWTLDFSEKELRLIRFGLLRAIESI